MSKQSPMLPEPLPVDAAVIWDEGYRSYPGRSHGRGVGSSETRSKACREKSAEAIVPFFFREGPNNRKS